MAMPSLMVTRWVGQNSGPIFCCFGAKVHKFASAGVSIVCNAIFCSSGFYKKPATTHSGIRTLVLSHRIQACYR